MSQIKLIEKIFTNMHIQKTSLSSTGMLLAGNPGVGKTSFIRMFAQLIGLNLVVIEVPHIVEEHIINVPFIVFKNNGQTQTGQSQVEGDSNSYDIHLSDSHLASIVREQPALNNQTYLKSIYNMPQNVIDLFEQLGGSQTEIPDEIAEIRQHYKTILFLDEFFRKTSPRIRNMLRTILNGNIGLDKIPEGSYVIYASNLNDDAIDEVPLNTDFHTVQMEAPKYKDWKSYMTSKHGVENDADEESENAVPGDATVAPVDPVGERIQHEIR